MGAVLKKGFFALLLACTAVWGGLALYYTVGGLFAAAFGVVGLAAVVGIFVPRWRTRSLVAYLAVFVALLAWWSTIKPSNARNWHPEVAVVSYATIDGSKVTIHNIRNFDYRSETDFDVAYYDKTYDLDRLESADLVATYWMGPAIAHIFVSFGFSDGEHLAVSIETRKEQGEGYSSIKGFFRQYELYYVVADERDVIRVRTNFRENPPEDVYLYRLETPVENVRMIFLKYLEAINALTSEPEWYNTLTTNCTTAIWMHSRINPNHVPLSWKILASGYVPEYLYAMGRLDNGQSFDELQRAAHINRRAQEADGAPDFSRRIRAVETLPTSPR
jgi:hypothetical protein